LGEDRNCSYQEKAGNEDIFFHRYA
jgi:hypothetical protein